MSNTPSLTARMWIAMGIVYFLMVFFAVLGGFFLLLHLLVEYT